jgi:hypothetical protein
MNAAFMRADSPAIRTSAASAIAKPPPARRAVHGGDDRLRRAPHQQRELGDVALHAQRPERRRAASGPP